MGEYDHEADFSLYKTFGLLNWEKHNDDLADSETKQYILIAIKDELENLDILTRKKMLIYRFQYLL